MFEKLCDDFGSKRRERVVRLDVPLRAFDGPASSISNRLGGTRLTAAGTFVGPGGPALSAGLDDICAGLRDSIRAAYEARKAAYEAEVRGWAGCFCAWCCRLQGGVSLSQQAVSASGQQFTFAQHRPSCSCGGLFVGYGVLCMEESSLYAQQHHVAGLYVCGTVQVRKLHNDRREPGWSFTMLYLVKDSAALMLEGAGLW